jgi:mono/diheme cytochrome c family protein
MMRRVILTTVLFCAAFFLISQSAFASEKGRELINSLGCKGCHQFEGSGGSFGPSLDGTGARMSEDQIRQKMVNPKADNPNSAMPSYQHLPEGDLDEIVQTLKALN